MTIRWGRASSEVVPATSKIRWGRAASEGTAPATSVIRWGRAASEGTAAVVAAPLADRSNLEPETTVIVTAQLQGGGTADSWTWRRVSGPAVAITASGATAAVTAPSDINGTTLVLGVTATIGATTSPEVTVTLNVLPQTEWWWTGTGWIPRVELWTAPPVTGATLAPSPTLAPSTTLTTQA